MGDLLPGKAPEPSEELALDLTRAALESALAELPDAQRRVIELHYGLAGEEPLTLRPPADRLGISRESVRGLERDALDRLAMERELDALREAA